MQDLLDTTPEKKSVRNELKRLGAGEMISFYQSLIERAAEESTLIDALESDGDPPFKAVLKELNNLLRSIKRSKLSGTKIAARIENLSKKASTFVKISLSGVLDKEINLQTEDFSNPANRKALEKAVGRARGWVRDKPGTKRHRALEKFAHEVAWVYRDLTKKDPGVGGNPYGKDYQTPFERLWVACLRMLEPKATTLQAREIYRIAAGRR